MSDLMQRADFSSAGQATMEALAKHGYYVMRQVVSPALVQQASHDFAPHFERTPSSIGAFYGANTKRFHGLLSRSATIEQFVMHPLILEVARAILSQCDHSA